MCRNFIHEMLELAKNTQKQFNIYFKLILSINIPKLGRIPISDRPSKISVTLRDTR